MPVDSDDSQVNNRFSALKRSFRHRNYRLFFVGQLLSVTGAWMQLVAQSWLVYRLTGSPALLGLVGFASQIPILVLSPIGGAVADRLRRRHILLLTQSAAMALASTLAVLALSEHIQVWEIFVLAGLSGLTSAFDIPARPAFVWRWLCCWRGHSPPVRSSRMACPARTITRPSAGSSPNAIFLIPPASRIFLEGRKPSVALPPFCRRPSSLSAP